MTAPRERGRRRVLARLAGLALVPLALALLGARRRRRRQRPATPVVVWAPRSAQADVPRPAPPAPPPAPPRRSRRRLLLAAIVAAIVVVGAPLLYLTLRSSPAPPGSRVLAPMKMVSYYPPNAAWSYMWTRFDRAEIATDLERAHELGFDTVRIFVPPSAFGYPTPSAVMQTRLHEVVAAAAAADLRVGLALFDRFERYGDEDGSETWLRDVLHPYANDPAIAFVEVHNEIDPSNAAARSWYGEMLKVERATAPKIPTVASVPARVGVAGLRDAGAGARRGSAGRLQPALLRRPRLPRADAAARRAGGRAEAADPRRGRLLDRSGQPGDPGPACDRVGTGGAAVGRAARRVRRDPPARAARPRHLDAVRPRPRCDPARCRR